MANDNGPMILGITWMESGLIVMAIAVRFSARFKMKKNLGIEDWTMLLAVLLQLLGQSFLTIMVHYGLGRRINTLSREQITEYAKWSCLFEIPGVLSTSIARISVAVLLWRIFGSKTWFRWYLYLMTILQAAAALTLLIVWGAQCRPINALWGPAPGGRCWNPEIELAIATVFQSICTVIDFTYVLFPTFIIWHLSLELRMKVMLIAILSFGLVAMAASIIKTVENMRILNERDPSYDLTNVSIWLMTEQNIVIIVGCIPVWRSLFTHKPRKELAFKFLISKYFPPIPEAQSSSDLEALHDTFPTGSTSKHDDGHNKSKKADTLPVPPATLELERKDSIELPRLELIGRPSKWSGSL